MSRKYSFGAESTGVYSVCPKVQMLTRGFIWLPAKKPSQLEAGQCWSDMQSCGAPAPSHAKKAMKKNKRNSTGYPEAPGLTRRDSCCIPNLFSLTGLTFFLSPGLLQQGLSTTEQNQAGRRLRLGNAALYQENSAVNGQLPLRPSPGTCLNTDPKAAVGSLRSSVNRNTEPSLTNKKQCQGE